MNIHITWLTHVRTGPKKKKNSAPPIRQPVHRVPVCQRKELKELLTDMEEKDVIRPSSSHWASPIVLVKKRDGTH